MATLSRDIAADRGTDVVLVDDEGTRTWAEFDERVNRLVNGFREVGLTAGQTVAIVAGNRREWYEASFACSHAGLIFVPVNWHWVADEIAYVVEDAEVVCVVAGHRYAEEVAAALEDQRCAGVRLALLAGGGATDHFENLEEFLSAQSPAEPDNQVLGGPMFYTSGTTGRPKGVKGALITSAEALPPEVMQLVSAGFNQVVPVPGTTALCGPIYHSGQWAFSWLPMVEGSSVVMQHKFDPAGLLEMIDQHQATNIHLVPTQFKRLLDLPDEIRNNYDGGSMEVVIHGAAPCPPTVKRGMIDWWGPKVIEYYGATEGGIISYIDSNEWLERGGSVGRPQPDVEVIVVDDDGRRLGVGEEGSLYFRNATSGSFEYHNAPEKTAEAHLEPGVFTSGDVGFLDEEGYLWLSDRKIDMVISGGVNIYPAEIEGVLAGHPSVADVAVIGIPNEEYGEELKAVVVVQPGVTPDQALVGELIRFCREHLAGYKAPRSVDFTDALPRTESGKIRKGPLREPHWEGLERRI